MSAVVATALIIVETAVRADRALHSFRQQLVLQFQPKLLDRSAKTGLADTATSLSAKAPDLGTAVLPQGIAGQANTIALGCRVGTCYPSKPVSSTNRLELTIE